MRTTYHVVIGLVVSIGGFAIADDSKPPIPVLLDTDIGGAFDDALALGLVLASPELELRGVTTVHGDAYTRAMIVCRFLYAVGREEIPVASGAPPLPKPDLEGQMQYGLRAAQKHPVKESAVEFLYEHLKADPGEITLIAIGPLTNVAALFEKHPDAVKLVKRVVLMGGSINVGYSGEPPAEPEYNIKTDVAAAQKVFSSGAPLVVVPLDATATKKLKQNALVKILTAETALARNMRALYQLWGKDEVVVLFDPATVAIEFPETTVPSMRIGVDVEDDGMTRYANKKEAKATVVMNMSGEGLLYSLNKRLVRGVLPKIWPETLVISLRADGQLYVQNSRIAQETLPGVLATVIAAKARPKTVRLEADPTSPYVEVVTLMNACRDAGFDNLQLKEISVVRTNESKPVPRGNFPHRIHVIENYETDIERRWWLSGKLETKDVPPDSKRACRAVLCNDFDDLMGDRFAMYKAVIFNPVPGPPMGKHTRLAFRYKLSGTDTLRVQIYSLSNGYHRQLTLSDLKQDEWQEAAVDMTDARRPDGSGDALAEDERIDDIQFYTDPKAELFIDDIVLYDAAAESEERPFPSRPIFTGWFDTGEQGKEWPGRFEIVPHEKPLTWDAARAVPTEDGKAKEIYIDLRGPRPLGATTKLRFRYLLRGADEMQIALVGDEESKAWTTTLAARPGEWAEGEAVFETGADPPQAAGVRITIPADAELLADDVLLYE